MTTRSLPDPKPPSLFDPFALGTLTLANRVVSQGRALDNHQQELIHNNFVIPAKAGIHPSASTCGTMGSRFRGKDDVLGNEVVIVERCLSSLSDNLGFYA